MEGAVPESRKSTPFLVPQLVPNAPKLCHIVAMTAKQCGEANIFI